MTTIWQRWEDLEKIGKDCELGTLQNSLLADMVITGLRNKRIQESLLRKEGITLDEIIKNCKAAEISTSQAKIMHKDSECEMNISTVRNEWKNKKFFPTKYNQPKSYPNKDKPKEKVENCKYCSYSHVHGSCPAYNKICTFCSKKGHFAKCCFKNKPNKSVSQVKANAEKTCPVLVSDSDSSDDSCNFFVGAINEWGLGCFSNVHHIYTDADTKPSVNPPRTSWK